MNDKANFSLNGFVNKQNCRIWPTKNPRNTHRRLLQTKKCTAWCGVSSERIIDPYFFENEPGAVTINGALYCTMLDNFV